MTYALREELEKTRDYAKAFHSYPDALNFEKAMLNKLIQNPHDFIGAFKELPKNLLMMFVNAYESVLFNKILSERIRRKIPIHQAIIGDIISPVRKNVIINETIPVTESNIDKVNIQIIQKKSGCNRSSCRIRYRCMQMVKWGKSNMPLLIRKRSTHGILSSLRSHFFPPPVSRRPLLALLPCS